MARTPFFFVKGRANLVSMATTEQSSILRAKKASYLEDLKSSCGSPAFRSSVRSDHVRRAPVHGDGSSEAGFDNVSAPSSRGGSPLLLRLLFRKGPASRRLLLYAHHDVHDHGRCRVRGRPAIRTHQRRAPLRAAKRRTISGDSWCTPRPSMRWLKGAGVLPLNVKVILEGNRNRGIGPFGGFLRKCCARKSRSPSVLTDTCNLETGCVDHHVVLRVSVAGDVESARVSSIAHRHVGASPFPDPVWGLCRMLAILTNPDGSIAIPGMSNR